ncbi:MAG: hypothetical protein KDK35_22090, partial [Leptospiraceae bacterium]|nr:hypothetical protein [Leptospiraceae bacterium]
SVEELSVMVLHAKDSICGFNYIRFNRIRTVWICPGRESVIFWKGLENGFCSGTTELVPGTDEE